MRPLVFWLVIIGALILLAAFVPSLHQQYAAALSFPVLDRGFNAFAGSVFIIMVQLFFAPGGMLIDWFWRRVLGLSSSPFNSLLMPVFVVFLLAFPFIFWRFSLSRLGKFCGVWDPFTSFHSEPLLWVMKAGVRLREWFEIVTKFGRVSTGGWAGLIDVLSSRYKDGQVFLGRPKLIIGGMLRPIGISTEKHIVTIASTGSGKSTAGLVPNLCLHRGSLLCVDPKGELAAITARRRGQGGNGVNGLGQDVYILDPFGIVPGCKTASYNVFDEMARVAADDVDRPVSYADKVAGALVKNLSEKERYFDNAAKTFLWGLILYVFAGPREKHNLMTVRRLVMEGDTEAYQQALRSGDIEDKDDLDAFDVLLEKMKCFPAGPYRDAIAGAAGSILRMGHNQLGSVITTAQEHTSFLDMPELRRISTKSDFLLEDLKNRKISVYLCLPLNAVAGKEGNWLRMFVLLLIDMMMRNRKAPKPPILLAIDEFPSLGRLDGIEVVAPTLRSYGVRFWAVGQDISQFKATYPESWTGFIGNAEAVQFMGVTHPATVDFVVERLGKHVVVDRVRENGKVREVRTERNLLDPDQVSRLLAKDRKNQIIWRGSKKPMLLKTAPYFDYMPCWYYDADKRYREKLRRAFWRWGGLSARGAGDAIPPAPVVEAPGAIAEKGRRPPELLSGPMAEWVTKAMGLPPETEAQRRLRRLLEKMMPPLRLPEAVRQPPPADHIGDTREGQALLEKQAKSLETAGAVAPYWLWKDIFGAAGNEKLRNLLKDCGAPVDPAIALSKADEADWDKRVEEWEKKFGHAPIDERIDEWNKLCAEYHARERGDSDAAASWADRLNAGNKEPPEPPAVLPAKPPSGSPGSVYLRGSSVDSPKKPPAGKGPEPWQEALARYNAIRAKEEEKALSAPLEELEKMIGLGAVKAEVKKTVKMVKLARAREEAGMPKVPLTRHLVFTGNPGTGKTTVAGIVGRIYKEAKVLKSGHVVVVDRADLVGKYAGQTAPKVVEAVKRAMDGVLFIDEAYSLAQEGQDDYGAEAVTELVRLMEEHRDRLIVIAAGYSDEMKRFIHSNPGLESRFKTFIEFPDYEGEELQAILGRMFEEAGCRLSMDAMVKATELMMSLKRGKGFGNGRAVRNIFEECLARQAVRLDEREGSGTVDVRILEAEDIPDKKDLPRLLG